MEQIYIIGAGAIGKVLAVCLKLSGRNTVLIRGSVADCDSVQQTIKVRLSGGEVIEAEITISALDHFDQLDGLVVLTNKSYGNAGLAFTLKDKIGRSPVVLLQNGLRVEQVFIDAGFPAVYRCVLFATSQPVSEIELNFKAVAISPIGMIYGGKDGVLDQIASLLNTLYFGFRAEREIEPIIWKKAIVNSVFNSVCPLLEVDNGIFHRNLEALQIAESIIAECLSVAAEHDVLLKTDEVLESLILISRFSDGQFISTLQDIRHKRPTEIETLNLSIARMAQAAGREQDVIRTSLLGRLTLLKSQLARHTQLSDIG